MGDLGPIEIIFYTKVCFDYDSAFVCTKKM